MPQKTTIVAPQTLSSTPQDRFEEPNQIYVGIVTSHSLVDHHLFDMININSNMVPVILGDRTKNPTVFPSNAKMVVLIDLWHLFMPTSSYLDHFAATMPKCVFLASDRARNGVEVAGFLRAGFSGFISHDETMHSIGPAISAIAEGSIWTSPEALRIYINLTSKRTKMHGVGIEILTAREEQAMELLRRRCSNKEMASLLKISESTVKFHVSNVLMKLNVNDRRDLTDGESFSGPRLLIADQPSQRLGITVQLEPLGVDIQDIKPHKLQARKA